MRGGAAWGGSFVQDTRQGGAQAHSDAHAPWRAPSARARPGKAVLCVLDVHQHAVCVIETACLSCCPVTSCSDIEVHSLVVGWSVCSHLHQSIKRCFCRQRGPARPRRQGVLPRSAGAVARTQHGQGWNGWRALALHGTAGEHLQGAPTPRKAYKDIGCFSSKNLTRES